VRTVILGARGQLGRELAAILPAETTTALDRADLDITDAAAVARTLTALRPTVVMNATAENRVDFAEADPGPAIAVNATAVATVAQACRALGAFLVHVSTDYVFDGRLGRAYTEDDPPNPQGAYARSKLAGELLTQAATPRHAIVRVAGLYAHGGSRGKGGSFVDKILMQAQSAQPLRVVSDQITAPTWARDVASALAALLPRWVDGSAPCGIYHLTNAGACSWHEFAKAIVAGAGLAVPVEAVSTASFAAPAPRPAYSVLANTRLAAVGVPGLRSWNAALAGYLASRPSG
jgi:dTDP-4-dehydrorhamnose reductase